MRKSIFVAGFLTLSLAAVNVQAATATLINDGFEASWNSTISSGQDGNVRFNYQPTGANIGWTFEAGTGVVNPRTSNVSAAEGSQYAFLQMASGKISQTFNVAQNSVADLSFFYGLRPYYAAGQQLQVYLDNQLVNTFTAANTAPLTWTSASFSLGTLAAGSHTLAFAGTGNQGLDTTMFLDKVAVNVSAVPEPTSALMLSLGLGGLLLATRRRQFNR